ncbi:MAG: hypothetical protein N3D12_00805 [Candidatus Methanomethyliaceae archaeon]|nr:hypothetical protein [Candidatus Methanomethyliaceae archaeon]
MDINMRVLVCTSLRPSPRTRTFCRDLGASSSIFQYYVRGKSNILSLMSYAYMNGAQKVWLVSSRHGNPGTITFYEVRSPYPTIIGSIIIKGVTLRRELGNLYPKSTRMRPLTLIPPKDDSLKDLHSLIKRSLPDDIPSKTPCTQLCIVRSAETSVELLFIESQTGLLCGPKISLSDYIWEKRS